MNDLSAATRPDPRFPVTRWSVVAEACDPGDPESAAALEDLCRTYWMPLYAAVRRFGHEPEDAEDLTQGFFARLLEKDWLQAADREKGRFRTFLMVALKRYLANEWHRGQAAKRGGGLEPVPLDTRLAERLYGGSGAHSLTPEQLFDKRWALTLIETALARMEQEYREAGRGGEFEVLKPCLTAGRGEIDYARTGGGARTRARGRRGSRCTGSASATAACSARKSRARCATRTRWRRRCAP